VSDLVLNVPWTAEVQAQGRCDPRADNSDHAAGELSLLSFGGHRLEQLPFLELSMVHSEELSGGEGADHIQIPAWPRVCDFLVGQ
jgi:hypothetical protein